MTGVLLETQQISTDCQLIVVFVLVAGLGIGFLRLEDSGSPGSSDSEFSIFDLLLSPLSIHFHTFLTKQPLSKILRGYGGQKQH